MPPGFQFDNACKITNKQKKDQAKSVFSVHLTAFRETIVTGTDAFAVPRVNISDIELPIISPKRTKRITG